MVATQTPAFQIEKTRVRRTRAQVIVDSVIGIFGSALTLLIMPVVALAISLEDRGPSFFRSEFVDCDGTVRYYLKFRTMVRNADEILAGDAELRAQFSAKQKLKNDPRILRVGRVLRRSSIDEFPQFFSLLTGHLTMVGPRTISRSEMERYGELLPKLLSVKPGITGYWQVNGRQNTTYDERVRMDMFYVDHRSLRLDLRIIAKTFWTVLRGEGAY